MKDTTPETLARRWFASQCSPPTKEDVTRLIRAVRRECAREISKLANIYGCEAYARFNAAIFQAVDAVRGLNKPKE